MNAKKLRKRFTRMGEDATRAYLATAIPKLRRTQREVAAAEAALHSFERKQTPAPEAIPA